MAPRYVPRPGRGDNLPRLGALPFACGYTNTDPAGQHRELASLLAKGPEMDAATAGVFNLGDRCQFPEVTPVSGSQGTDSITQALLEEKIASLIIVLVREDPSLSMS
ncbi:hypothetical protein CSOJ01_07578 [Colletotrichum sojae]|uniref:Uncharacterized protein n=1 Tax=Colletotrichum sojae TaxID=2175907 RepID=A0A8H6MU79_9PEZI|nr:hypothetical protein CSOJ01_07578 [Colletotrichum sojae]